MRCYYDARGSDSPLEVDPALLYHDLRLPMGKDERPYVILNMISSLDGKAVFGDPGATWALGSELDHRLFKALRRSCDAVIAGAGLMQADDPPYPRVEPAERERRTADGLRAEPLWIIVSGRASISPNLRVFQGQRQNVLVIADRHADGENLAALASVAQLLLYEGPTLDWPRVAQSLRSTFGVHRLYSIGGPKLNAVMLEAELLDELFFTLSNKIQGGSGHSTMFEGRGYPPGQYPQARLISLHGQDDELFLRYALRAIIR